MRPPIDLALSRITKVYPGVVALQHVSLNIRGGEIVGLIGENGAGKSTLMKVLGGTIAPDGGAIAIDGESYDALTPSEATTHGIAFVHQELNTFANIDVAGNILLGREVASSAFRLLDQQAMTREVRPILDLLGARFRPVDSVADLSLAEQQILEIAKALSMKARLVIFDEPTSSLTLSETERLLDVMRQLKADGVAVLFISHRLPEIESVVDRAIVLRDGKNAGELARDEITKDRMVEMMIGRNIGRNKHHHVPARSEPALRIVGVKTDAYPSIPVDLTLYAGEILGLAGLVGAGRSELARAVFGVDARHAGEVTLNGESLAPNSVAASIEAGLCLVPENRKEEGLILDFAVLDNISLPNLGKLRQGWFVDRRAEARLGAVSTEMLAIKASTLQGAVSSLSGGNQQKVVLAKWLATDPKVIIMDEPTRGIDVGAKGEVYSLMRSLADRGVAILMISSDMEEVIGVSDRVAVMSAGRVTGILPPEDLTEQNILRLAVG
ncbi:ATP-binding cassette domain-containing protein [Stappia sp. GBMRC 2046]|uniref:ATP-binding cassette domain-containing protein n=1 Tax=Stappia sediminis TaxID=2692190 RepID=A0A7X3LS17_9HYPH|nr:sugar ABC transporter ATP-binding protein [Stappia sediminis]MXN64039.1 ATP-binding cassette domain-containing protein [Stappia sediminis]